MESTLISPSATATTEAGFPCVLKEMGEVPSHPKTLVLVAHVLQKGQKSCKAIGTFGEVLGQESFSTGNLEIG